MPRIRKGGAFALLTLGSLVLCPGALLTPYAEGAIETRGLVSGLAVASDVTLVALGGAGAPLPLVSGEGEGDTSRLE